MKNIRQITEKDLLTPFDEFEHSNSIIRTRNDLSKKYIGRPSARYYKESDFSITLPKVLQTAHKLMESFRKKWPR